MKSASEQPNTVAVHKAVGWNSVISNYEVFIPPLPPTRFMAGMPNLSLTC